MTDITCANKGCIRTIKRTKEISTREEGHVDQRNNNCVFEYPPYVQIASLDKTHLYLHCPTLSHIKSLCSPIQTAQSTSALLAMDTATSTTKCDAYFKHLEFLVRVARRRHNEREKAVVHSSWFRSDVEVEEIQKEVFRYSMKCIAFSAHQNKDAKWPLTAGTQPYFNDVGNLLDAHHTSAQAGAGKIRDLILAVVYTYSLQPGTCGDMAFRQCMNLLNATEPSKVFTEQSTLALIKVVNKLRYKIEECLRSGKPILHDGENDGPAPKSEHIREPNLVETRLADQQSSAEMRGTPTTYRRKRKHPNLGDSTLPPSLSAASIPATPIRDEAVVQHLVLCGRVLASERAKRRRTGGGESSDEEVGTEQDA